MSGRVSVFPLAGALLFPNMHLPLHIFEPRYRSMVSDALARDRRIRGTSITDSIRSVFTGGLPRRG